MQDAHVVYVFAGVEFILPTDVIIADKFDENAESKVVAVDAIPEDWMVSELFIFFARSV